MGDGCWSANSPILRRGNTCLCAVEAAQNQARFGSVSSTVWLSFSSYQDEYYYWEIIISVRKMAFAAVAVLLTPVGSNIAVVCGLLVVYIATTSHAVTNPYHLPGMDRVELAGLVTTFPPCLLAHSSFRRRSWARPMTRARLEVLYPAIAKKEQEALSLFIVGINAIYMVYVLYFLYTRVKHNVAHFFTTVKKYRRGSFKSISEARKFYRSGTSTTQTPRSEKVEGAPPVNLRLSTSSGIGLGTPSAGSRRSNASSAEAAFIIDNPMRRDSP